MLVLNIVNFESLKKLHDGSFPLPDLTDPAFIGRKTVIDNKTIVGFGLVKQTLEGILVLDHSLPLLTRTRATRELINSFKEDMSSIGQRECHVFVKNNSNFENFLSNMGFVKCLGGTPMVIHF